MVTIEFTNAEIRALVLRLDQHTGVMKSAPLISAKMKISAADWSIPKSPHKDRL